MNYIFISPNYPAGHWRYIAALREAGHNVYAVGDAGDETFPAELRGNLCDYYRVGDLHDFDAVYRGCCYIIGKYGRCQCIESLNPYWCDLVATLRCHFLNELTPENCYSADFAARSENDMDMRLSFVTSGDAADQAAAVGYPISLTSTGNKREHVRVIHDEKELAALDDGDLYCMRRVFDGEPVSVDVLFCNAQKSAERPEEWQEVMTVLWAAHAIGDDGSAYCLNVDDVALAPVIGEMMVNITESDSAMVFCHADCVRLTKAVKGVGKKGDIVLNSWSKTPPHEFIIDCINIEYDCDTRYIWASGAMPETLPEKKYSAAVACRSFERSYKYSHEKLLRRFGGKLRLHGLTHDFDKGAYLDYHYIFAGADSAELKRGIKYITDDYALSPEALAFAAEKAQQDEANAAEMIENLTAAAADEAPRDEYAEEFELLLAADDTDNSAETDCAEETCEAAVVEKPCKVSSAEKTCEAGSADKPCENSSTEIIEANAEVCSGVIDNTSEEG